jgi:peptide/nickel transport system permease protein
MLRYLLTRAALLVPTFFLISLVVFVVLNIAPGRPGAGNEALGENPQQSASDRIFREQFGLDKPILLNTRAWLSGAEVRRLLALAYDVGGVAPTMAARVRAKETLDDLGNAMVRHLIPLLEDPDPDVQRLAALRLTSAAALPLRNERSPTPEDRETNKRVLRENRALETLRWEKGDLPERVAEVKAAWHAWWGTHEDQFTYTTGEGLRMLFLETRFARYWSNLLSLDFGVSNADRRPVLGTLLSKVKYSVSLALVSVLLAYLIAVPIGVFSAIRQGSAVDTAMTVFLFLLFSLPTFFAGTVYLRLFTEGDPFSWFPSGGWESHDAVARTTFDRIGDVAWHLVLPVVTYTAGTLAALSRYARTGVIDVIRADYVRTARAKGLAEPVVIVKHAARNGMIPILTLLASLLPVLVGGSVVIEVIFNIPGMGLFLFDAINLRDYNVVMAVLLASSALALLGILLSDVAYALVDPRISFE